MDQARRRGERAAERATEAGERVRALQEYRDAAEHDRHPHPASDENTVTRALELAEQGHERAAAAHLSAAEAHELAAQTHERVLARFPAEAGEHAIEAQRHRAEAARHRRAARQDE